MRRQPGRRRVEGECSVAVGGKEEVKNWRRGGIVDLERIIGRRRGGGGRPCKGRGDGTKWDGVRICRSRGTGTGTGTGIAQG